MTAPPIHAYRFALCHMIASATGTTPAPITTPMNCASIGSVRELSARGQKKAHLVKPAHGEADRREDTACDAHDESPADDTGVVDAEHLLFGRGRTDVRQVDVVREDRRGRAQLGRRSRGDRQELLDLS